MNVQSEIQKFVPHAQFGEAAATRIPEIVEQITRLERVEDRLGNLAAQLDERLGYICSPPPPPALPVADRNGYTTTMTPMATDLARKATGLEATADCLGGILERLEI